MKTCSAALVCALLLLPVAPASAGIQLDGLFGAGLNVCQASGHTECDRLESNVTLLAAPGVKLTDHIGLYLDFHYGWLSSDTGDFDGLSVSTMQLMPTVRGSRALGSMEAFAGLGAGYSAMSIEGETDGASGVVHWSGLFNFKLTAGAVFTITDNVALGGNIDYVVNVNESGEICFDAVCQDFEGHMFNLVQASLIVKLTL